MEMSDEGFSVDPDPSIWIVVPLTFPTDDDATAEAWADRTVAALASGVDMPDDTRQQLLELARTIATVPSPYPDASARFWFFPTIGGPMHLAHLYLAPRATLPGLSLVDVANGGGGFAPPQRAERIELPGFSEAWLVALLGEIEQPAQAGDEVGSVLIGSVRIVAETRGIVVMLDATASELAVLGVMEQALVGLAATVRVGLPGD